MKLPLLLATLIAIPVSAQMLKTNNSELIYFNSTNTTWHIERNPKLYIAGEITNLRFPLNYTGTISIGTNYYKLNQSVTTNFTLEKVN